MRMYSMYIEACIIVKYVQVCISPDDAFIVRNIFIEILLLFIVWNVTKYGHGKCYTNIYPFKFNKLFTVELVQH